MDSHELRDGRQEQNIHRAGSACKVTQSYEKTNHKLKYRATCSQQYVYHAEFENAGNGNCGRAKGELKLRSMHNGRAGDKTSTRASFEHICKANIKHLDIWATKKFHEDNDDRDKEKKDAEKKDKEKKDKDKKDKNGKDKKDEDCKCSCNDCSKCRACKKARENEAKRAEAEAEKARKAEAKREEEKNAAAKIVIVRTATHLIRKAIARRGNC